MCCLWKKNILLKTYTNNFNKFVDNVGIINETCKLANINRVSPKTINFEDDLVWSKIEEDTSLLFQINSDYGKRTVNKMFEKNVWEKIKKNVPNITRFDLLAFICALVRPCGKNVYPIVTEGNSRRTGIKEMDELLGPEMGYPILQETQMEFVQKFCGFSFLESDKLRKCVAKGSLITMADGSLKPIEKVEVGEEVLSYKDGQFVPKKVVGHYDNGIMPIIQIKFENGSILECTFDHKILTNHGWVDAGTLSKHDFVITNTNESHILNVTGFGKTRISHVWDLEIEDTHNYLVSGIIGHNCIAKKKGTREQLPLIKEGFEKNAKVKYNLTQEQSDEIINPFLQCILDATRYAFARAHDYSYTAISYESAWLRTYYPLEYLTCCFNSYVDKQEKINEVTEYCVRNKIKIQNPKFRYSKSDYFFDKEQKTIYKGTRSIKFLNAAVSDALYNLRDRKYNDFTDALQDIFETGIDARQLNILIKLDYFSEFGNSKELLKIVDMTTMFKNGKAKSVSKSKIENDNILYRIVARNSNETPKKFTINDCIGILKECEFYIKSVDIKDFTFKEKANFQMEYMGYIDLKTNIEKDRPNIFILSIRKLKSKTASEPWAVQIDGQSIGSGIRNSYTIFYKDYKKEPFEKNDIIRIKRFHKNPRGYWNVDSYERMYGI